MYIHHLHDRFQNAGSGTSSSDNDSEDDEDGDEDATTVTRILIKHLPKQVCIFALGTIYMYIRSEGGGQTLTRGREVAWIWTP